MGRVFSSRKFKDQSFAKPANRIAILVPAYKEDGIIISTAKNLILQDYPKDLYDVYIIADSFLTATLDQLHQLPIYMVAVSFEKSTKTKSLNEAFARISKEYDIAVICDADNMLGKDFLQKINTSFVNGAEAIQGQRVAKNLDTSFAILDACSEGINNNIFRKGANALGISSSVIGSGMAFNYGVIKHIMSEINAVGGFDKIMQLKIVEKGIIIHYLEDALIFDEKVDSAQSFKQQRKRWISSQFIYLKKFFIPAFKQLFRGNISYFNLAVANNLILPRAFMFLILPVLIVASFLVHSSFGISAILLLAFYLLSLFLALPTQLINKNLFHALLKLPKAIVVMLGTLLHLRKANKEFIHTVHTKTEVSNTLFDNNRNTTPKK